MQFFSCKKGLLNRCIKRVSKCKISSKSLELFPRNQIYIFIQELLVKRIGYRSDSVLILASNKYMKFVNIGTTIDIKTFGIYRI